MILKPSCPILPLFDSPGGVEICAWRARSPSHPPFIFLRLMNCNSKHPKGRFPSSCILAYKPLALSPYPLPSAASAEHFVHPWMSPDPPPPEGSTPQFVFSPKPLFWRTLLPRDAPRGFQEPPKAVLKPCFMSFCNLSSRYHRLICFQYFFYYFSWFFDPTWHPKSTNIN